MLIERYISVALDRCVLACLILGESAVEGTGCSSRRKSSSNLSGGTYQYHFGEHHLEGEGEPITIPVVYAR